MKLSAQQHAVLTAICDTFAPRAEGWPSASDLGIPGAIAEAMDFNPRKAAHKQFLQLLDIWDSRAHALLTVGKTARFSQLSEAARQRMLLAWADSSIGRRRAAFQALRKAVTFLYVMTPSLKGARTPVWDNLKYPGLPGQRTNSSPRALRISAPSDGGEFSGEVCVIGSGAGGATAAAVLAKSGKDVLVMEAGGYYDDADFDGGEMSAYRRLYAENGFAATVDHSVGLLAGECLGGGTVINYTTCFRTPDDVRAEWTASGVPWFSSDEYSRSLDAVCARLSVNIDNNRISAREQILNRGLRALGWHVDTMPRNVIACEQGTVCGYCGFGCSIGAKQSTTKTWLLDAQKHGAGILTETRADKLIIENGQIRGVEAHSHAGQRITVRCKAVIVACGAIHTPALLLRSGLRNPFIGKNLHLHPVSNVCGIFDEEIRPWEGTMQAIYSDQHRFLSGNYGVKYETTALQPVIAAAVLPWREPAQYRSILRQLSNTVGIGVLLRDRDGGRVTVTPQGHALAHYALSSFDLAHLRQGFINAAKILEAAGARLIFSPHTEWCAYEPGRSTPESFTTAMDSAGWDAGRVALFSFHIMGSARLGSSHRSSATNPDGETWEVRNLFVMDGSSFPSASGVNPMITIEAVAHRNASALAAKL
jgi:long-chain-alcohol oxidase